MIAFAFLFLVDASYSKIRPVTTYPDSPCDSVITVGGTDFSYPFYSACAPYAVHGSGMLQCEDVDSNTHHIDCGVEWRILPDLYQIAVGKRTNPVEHLQTNAFALFCPIPFDGRRKNQKQCVFVPVVKEPSAYFSHHAPPHLDGPGLCVKESVDSVTPVPMTLPENNGNRRHPQTALDFRLTQFPTTIFRLAIEDVGCSAEWRTSIYKPFPNLDHSVEFYWCPIRVHPQKQSVCIFVDKSIKDEPASLAMVRSFYTDE